MQEKPDSRKKFREDLYKKLVSGDDLAARRPYGYVTRVLRIVGWKRVETNDLLQFKNVSEQQLREKLLAECVMHEEMECVSIDATMRCCVPVLGQSRLKATPQERSAAAFTEEESYRRDACVRHQNCWCFTSVKKHYLRIDPGYHGARADECGPSHVSICRGGFGDSLLVPLRSFDIQGAI